MNDDEKYLFDLRGFLVVRNALTHTQVADLSQGLEQHRQNNPQPILGSDRTVLSKAKDSAWSSPSLLELGGTFIDLLDLPAICLLYTSPSPRDRTRSRMPSSA